MFGGLTDQEHDWIRTEQNERRAQEGLPPLPETEIEKLKALVADIAKAWRWLSNLLLLCLPKKTP